jgi:hypothetical protein
MAWTSKPYDKLIDGSPVPACGVLQPTAKTHGLVARAVSIGLKVLFMANSIFFVQFFQ